MHRFPLVTKHYEFLQLWKKVLPHIGLVVGTILYVIFGAVVIRNIEIPHWQRAVEKSVTELHVCSTSSFLHSFSLVYRWHRMNWRMS